MITPFDPCPLDATWRAVASNDYYEVSEHGHLRRAVGGSNSKKGKIIKPHRKKNGYSVRAAGAALRSRLIRLLAVIFYFCPQLVRPSHHAKWLRSRP